MSDKIAEIYAAESRRVLATLVRLLNDIDLAEEALQDALATAVEVWPKEGLPGNPRAWLVSAGRFRAIDLLRRRKTFDAARQRCLERLERIQVANHFREDVEIEDDRLRLIFTCCHPSISPEVQVALTLREVCGLTTEEIAHAFLVSPTTMAQRLVRGKAKIRDAGIPVRLPSAEELPERLASVLTVAYLVFSEGYSATFGPTAVREDLSAEAIRLGRLLLELLPHPEVMGLLALMLLQESRRPARVNKDGDIVLLEEQDRSLWNKDQIQEGAALVERSLATRNYGPYTIQSAIAAVHSNARTAQQTDWAQIVLLYDILLASQSTPVIRLNRAVAVAMRDQPEEGLRLIDELFTDGHLQKYHLAHAAQADLLRRMGRFAEAKAAYLNALAYVQQEPERRFLQRRLSEVSSPTPDSGERRN
ncbi:MAG: RNA polymerase sigma factor [Planctomycetaceae bacterium]|nr:RNA polymerase sigma factor [Planctomycetaceae bacterium]